MKNSLIGMNETIWAITERYPETIPVFVSGGFPGMNDPARRRELGTQVTLETALAMKRMNAALFLERLEAAIRMHRGADGGEAATASVRVSGLLPCPVRLPLLDAFEGFVKRIRNDSGLHIEYDLQAASMGTSWIETHLRRAETADDLPDLFISAGFDLFFDGELLGGFKSAGVFEDLIAFRTFNASFRGMSPADPEGHYTLLSVVPAVFLVHEAALGDRSHPRTWEDLLSPELERSVSLPVGDFDLFNSILLDILHRFGEEGILRLGRNLQVSMHPSQMVKGGGTATAPAVTILPLFFTRMARLNPGASVVWPRDGAIVSPIFMLAGGERKRLLKPVADFFASREVGEILAHQGLFPSVHPEVDNRIDPQNRFRWLGWETIYRTDIPAAIRKAEALFRRASGEVTP